MLLRNNTTSEGSSSQSLGNRCRRSKEGKTNHRLVQPRAPKAWQSVRLAATPTAGNGAADETPRAFSLGVPIRPLSNEEALETVSNKSFACTMCGKCCTMAGDAEVWISDAEVQAIAGHLQLERAAFTALYCQPYDKLPGWRLLMSKQQKQQQQQQEEQLHHQRQPQGLTATASASPTGVDLPMTHCVFQDEASRGCTIYPVRPLQCSTYPWWPELMSNENWQMEKNYMCEGFDHTDAEPLDRWYAAQQLQQAVVHTLAFEHAKPPNWDVGKELYGEGQLQQLEQQLERW